MQARRHVQAAEMFRKAENGLFAEIGKCAESV